MKTFLLRGGVLLGGSALLSKLLGLWRDRLVVQSFPVESADLIYAAFRIPDFFYYLLVGATVSVIFLPRIVELNETQKHEYFSSFLWGVLLCFGGLSGAGVLFAEPLASVFAAGFTTAMQAEIAQLAQLLFGSVFLLSISSVFAAGLQAQERFLALAVAPMLYMGSIALGLYWLEDTIGITVVGFSALVGSLLHLFITSGTYSLRGGSLAWIWGQPRQAWQNFWGDFTRRVSNNAAFQINQSADVWIASFLMLGSVTAFTLGTNVGHFLLSIVGLSVANSAFPKLSKAKHNYPAQQKIWLSSVGWILVICVPTAALCAWYSEPLLQLLFGLSGERLAMTNTVFWWTVISLPFACVLPVCSRVFLANDDTKTPLYATITSLLIATGLAAYLSLVYLPKEEAILGLALGNFTANTLGFVLFMSLIWWKYERHHV